MAYLNLSNNLKELGAHLRQESQVNQTDMSTSYINETENEMLHFIKKNNINIDILRTVINGTRKWSNNLNLPLYEDITDDEKDAKNNGANESVVQGTSAGKIVTVDDDDDCVFITKNETETNKTTPSLAVDRNKRRQLYYNAYTTSRDLVLKYDPILPFTLHQAIQRQTCQRGITTVSETEPTVLQTKPTILQTETTVSETELTVSVTEPAVSQTEATVSETESTAPETEPITSYESQTKNILESQETNSRLLSAIENQSNLNKSLLLRGLSYLASRSSNISWSPQWQSTLDPIHRMTTGNINMADVVPPSQIHTIENTQSQTTADHQMQTNELEPPLMQLTEQQKLSLHQPLRNSQAKPTIESELPLKKRYSMPTVPQQLSNNKSTVEEKPKRVVRKPRAVRRTGKPKAAETSRAVLHDAATPFRNAQNLNTSINPASLDQLLNSSQNQSYPRPALHPVHTSKQPLVNPTHYQSNNPSAYPSIVPSQITSVNSGVQNSFCPPVQRFNCPTAQYNLVDHIQNNSINPSDHYSVNYCNSINPSLSHSASDSQHNLTGHPVFHSSNRSQHHALNSSANKPSNPTRNYTVNTPQSNLGNIPPISLSLNRSQLHPVTQSQHNLRNSFERQSHDRPQQVLSSSNHQANNLFQHLLVNPLPNTSDSSIPPSQQDIVDHPQHNLSSGQHSVTPSQHPSLRPPVFQLSSHCQPSSDNFPPNNTITPSVGQTDHRPQHDSIHQSCRRNSGNSSLPYAGNPSQYHLVDNSQHNLVNQYVFPTIDTSQYHLSSDISSQNPSDIHAHHIIENPSLDHPCRYHHHHCHANSSQCDSVCLPAQHRDNSSIQYSVNSSNHPQPMTSVRHSEGGSQTSLPRFASHHQQCWRGHL